MGYVRQGFSGLGLIDGVGMPDTWREAVAIFMCRGEVGREGWGRCKRCGPFVDPVYHCR